MFREHEPGKVFLGGVKPGLTKAHIDDYCRDW